MKRLYKNDYDKRISGVCSGIAEYFGIDPTLVRILWAILALFWGTGAIAYIICALILPNKSQL